MSVVCLVSNSETQPEECNHDTHNISTIMIIRKEHASLEYINDDLSFWLVKHPLKMSTQDGSKQV